MNFHVLQIFEKAKLAVYSVQRNDSSLMFFLITVLLTTSSVFSSFLIGSIEDELSTTVSVWLLPNRSFNKSIQFDVHSISSSPPRQSTIPSHFSDFEMHLAAPQTQVCPGQF